MPGFVNAILYSATRKIVSLRALLPFSRLISSRSANLHGTSTSKSSLDAMQFAIPTDPAMGEWHAKLWPDKPPGLANIDGFAPGVDTCRVFGCGGVPGGGDDPHGDARFSRPRTGSLASAPSNSDISLATTTTDTTTDGVPRLHHKRFSGWSLPSVRGDRARGPGEDEGARAEAGVGACTGAGASCPGELEEMRFAAPSPELRGAARAGAGTSG